MESFVNDFPSGKRKTANLFLQCKVVDWGCDETNKVKNFTVPFNGLVQTSVSGEARAWSGTELRSGAEPKKIKLIFLTVPFSGLVQTSVSGEASGWWSGTELRSGAEPEERGNVLAISVRVWSGAETKKGS
jgi:hypothetical protein